MKRTALLVATLLAGLMAAPAIQASPLTLLQQLFGVGSADDVTTQQEGGHPGYGPGPYGYGGGYPGYDSDESTADTSVEGSGVGSPGYGRSYYLGYGCR